MFRVRHVVSTLACLALLVAGYARSQGAKPLSEADIVKLIELQIDDQVLVARIEKLGLGFSADEAALKRLKEAGASEAVQAALKKAGPSKKAATGKVVTYQDVLKLLDLGIPEDKIVERLGPAIFTLSAEQVAELKKAGASDQFIKLLKRERPGGTPVGQLTDLAIIFDCSGSMSERTKEGPTKMEVAKKVLGDLIPHLPEGRLRLTFVIYGHDKELKCEAVKVVRPLAALDAAGKAELVDFVAALQPAGHTPIAKSLRLAGKELAKQTDALCGMVLITDGIETCHGDPAAEAKQLTKELNLTWGVNVVGFGLNEKENQAVAVIAEEGKGKYFPAQNPKELREALVKVLPVPKELAEEPEAKGKARRRVLVVPEPRGVKFPPLKEIRVYAAGSYNPNAFRDNNVAIAKYGEAVRLPSGGKYDVYWCPAEGQRVLLKKDFCIPEPVEDAVELKPEGLLGVVRVSGDGMPKVKEVFLAQNYNPNAFSRGQQGIVQAAKKYGTPLVVPAGTYELYIVKTDGGKQRLEDKLEVRAGKVTEVE